MQDEMNRQRAQAGFAPILAVNQAKLSLTRNIRHVLRQSANIFGKTHKDRK
jgi:hypothetical protein